MAFSGHRLHIPLSAVQNIEMHAFKWAHFVPTPLSCEQHQVKYWCSLISFVAICALSPLSSHFSSDLTIFFFVHCSATPPRLSVHIFHCHRLPSFFWRKAKSCNIQHINLTANSTLQNAALLAA
uniref:Uncharacterized protein n=1 Tax=Trypanosoma vivax (strain Y486) TaxID=1055687 RepID=G0TXX6_TRYVY|nr:hypothetical protein TVY486_0701570 [Trypanosoma vivax Y486]